MPRSWKALHGAVLNDQVRHIANEKQVSLLRISGTLPAVANLNLYKVAWKRIFSMLYSKLLQVQSQADAFFKRLQVPSK